MIPLALFVAAVAGLASANPPAAGANAAADARATPCDSIENCDFDQQCIQGTCHIGTASPYNAARAAESNAALVCSEDACRLATNYIGNPDLALLATAYSPSYGPGVGGVWVSEWMIEGTAGVVINPLLGAGGLGWKTNEVAVRAFFPDGGFSYTLQDLPVGHIVTLTFMMRDSQGTYVCVQPSTYVLYVEVDGYPKQTFRVVPHAGKKRGSFQFVAVDSTVKIRFSTEKDAYDGCGPFFTSVKAVA